MGTTTSRYYCGNNQLAEPGKPRGSRYQCFRTGIGRGRNLPYDRQYTEGYNPIDNRKIYCGDKHRTLGEANAALRPGDAPYDYMGNAPMCLQKGVGIGKSIRAREGPGYQKLLLYMAIWLILSAAATLILYYSRPSFILDENQEVQASLLSLYSGIVSFVIAVILTILYILG
ncbi:hypothetical protein KA005_37410 [bacterium]|nr:hypothetical protein [bacterium]